MEGNNQQEQDRMPNWCTNAATIEFENRDNYEMFKVAIENSKMAEVVEGCPTLFERIYPSPDKNYTNEWCSHNWGTKWPEDDAEYTTNDDTMTVYASFRTAWSPPEGIYNRLESGLSPFGEGITVKACFSEQGCDFIGYWKDEDGESVLYSLSEASMIARRLLHQRYGTTEAWDAAHLDVFDVDGMWEEITNEIFVPDFFEEFLKDEISSYVECMIENEGKLNPDEE